MKNSIRFNTFSGSRNFIQLISIATFALVVGIGCAKQSNSTAATPAQVATPTVDQNCAVNPNDIRCGASSNYYNMYNQYGWSSYPNWQNNQSGNNLYCNCPDGSRPIYHPNYGLGCVVTQQVRPLLTFSFYIGVGSQQVNPYQQSYFYPVSGNCYSQAIYSCTVNSYNACPNGGYCRQVNYNSPFGVCQN
ncbi:MAG TPA: hypothetical protein PLU50_03010 [Pseudobdellovibrionaceae bacterium]|nr:hypothetical protein [Pseudobdellovibrionaceae bacterium]